MSLFWFNLRKKFIKPYAAGHLPALNGHAVFYQQIGNPKGIPVISFHGGPGGSSRAKHAAVFNRRKYRVIMFDQRACGQSTAEKPFYKNTIQDTVKDAARLLDFLGIREKVIAAGASYGTTCALLFAQTYPERVSKIVLNSVFLARKRDAENISPATALFYPDMLEILQRQAVLKDCAAYYHRLALSPRKRDRLKALAYYGSWEKQLGKRAVALPQAADETRLRNVQIALHYEKNNFFMKDNQLLKNARKIAHIPTLIIHNRLDMCCPPYQAWELHRALPKSRLILMPGRGHGGDRLAYRQAREISAPDF